MSTLCDNLLGGALKSGKYYMFT